jgi:hypothetical protein
MDHIRLIMILESLPANKQIRISFKQVQNKVFRIIIKCTYRFLPFNDLMVIHWINKFGHIAREQVILLKRMFQS